MISRSGYRGRPAHEAYESGWNSAFAAFVDADPDPPAILSGMTELSMSMQGRLTGFQAVPPQIDGSPPRPFDWDVLFEAAQLDPKEFQPGEPQWTFIGTSDQRAAWTGTWPGADWPLRVE